MGIMRQKGKDAVQTPRCPFLVLFHSCVPNINQAVSVPLLCCSIPAFLTSPNPLKNRTGSFRDSGANRGKSESRAQFRKRFSEV
jgi:hypothetical protein